MAKFVKLHTEKDEMYFNLDRVLYMATENCRTALYIERNSSIMVKETIEEILAMMQ